MKYQFQNQPMGDLNSSARASFVQKVYSILSIQLGITALFVLLNIYSTTFAYIQYKYSILSWLMIGISIVTLLVLSKIFVIQWPLLNSVKPTQLIQHCWAPSLYHNHTQFQAFVVCIVLKVFYQLQLPQQQLHLE